MAKAVVYSLLATAFFMYITISSKTGKKQHGFVSSSRRLGYKVPIVVDFDPLVADIRRMLEEHNGHLNLDDILNTPLLNKEEKENVSFVQSFSDVHDYFNADGKLNVTLRLITLFPLLDTAPADNVISYAELENWNVQRALDRCKYKAGKEMASLDKNGDGAISFSEFMPQFSKKDIEENRLETGKAGWWMIQFNNADNDQSGTLNFTEFVDFLHPEDSKNEKSQKWVISEGIRKMDEDHDMKLNFREFYTHVYQTYKNQIKNIGGNVINASAKFSELDRNKDGVLDADELKPMLWFIAPGEVSEAKLYASYLMNQADEDRDGRLSMTEMLSHPNLFFSTLTTDESEDYNEFQVHDEL